MARQKRPPVTLAQDTYTDPDTKITHQRLIIIKVNQCPHDPHADSSRKPVALNYKNYGWNALHDEVCRKLYLVDSKSITCELHEIGDCARAVSRDTINARCPAEVQKGNIVLEFHAHVVSRDGSPLLELPPRRVQHPVAIMKDPAPIESATKTSSRAPRRKPQPTSQQHTRGLRPSNLLGKKAPRVLSSKDPLANNAERSSSPLSEVDDELIAQGPPESMLQSDEFEESYLRGRDRFDMMDIDEYYPSSLGAAGVDHMDADQSAPEASFLLRGASGPVLSRSPLLAANGGGQLYNATGDDAQFNIDQAPVMAPKKKGPKQQVQAAEWGDWTNLPDYVRIGEMRRLRDAGDDPDDPVIIMDYVAVAVIGEKSKEGKKVQEVAYHAVPTWKINDIQIGDYENADEIEQKPPHTSGKQEITPDAYWKQAFRSGLVDGPATDLLTRPATLKNSSQPEEPPIKPSYSDDDFVRSKLPVQVKDPDETFINTVIEYVNLSSAENIPWPSGLQSLPINHQATVALTETYDDLYKHVYNEVGIYNKPQKKGNKLQKEDDEPEKVNLEGTIKKLSKALGDWRKDVEIWVLPQRESDGTMYRWKKDSGLKAQDFLDSRMWKNGNHELYMEVHIVDHKPTVPELAAHHPGQKTPAKSSASTPATKSADTPAQQSAKGSGKKPVKEE